MLRDTFFNFTELLEVGNVLTTNITLNRDHEIFKGHFPQQPVVPGVCMMQMIKEVSESYAGKTLQLVKADNIKFLSFIDPSQNNQVKMELKVTSVDDHLRVDAQLLDNATSLFKFKGTFTEKIQ